MILNARDGMVWYTPSYYDNGTEKQDLSRTRRRIFTIIDKYLYNAMKYNTIQYNAT